MAKILLQSMVDELPLDLLPATWATHDFVTFSPTKRLWEYQQASLIGGVKALWKYYEEFSDYQSDEAPETNQRRKRALLDWYEDNWLKESLDLSLQTVDHKVANLLPQYYETKDSRITYDQLINRMCFWMATGSGKTLVLVKLIEILHTLITRGEIPTNDVLILTYRDDLLAQIRAQVEEFNASRTDFRIVLRELRDYASVKRENPVLFKDQELIVFYYRSDNLSDEQKDRIVDFRNYDNDGRWYVLLDEAHKGDREDSKRQHIYSILSRNGFLFNFSATFTDRRDYVTTVSNFNLAEFVREGYGKHLALLKQEIRAFKDTEDYSQDEKRRIVLKSLIMLTYVAEYSRRVRKVDVGLYHRPLLLTLVNKVNTEDADLKLYFRELEKIAKGNVPAAMLEQAKEELISELREQPELLFEQGTHIAVDLSLIESIGLSDILKSVYNADEHGDIEVRVRPSNRQELAFKLKTTERPFALVKIGDVSGWLKTELAGYEVNEQFADESFFGRLNQPDSDITVLLGSRSFYEGWDSNRPNVINYVNIGTGTEARKFILQSVGRGVRIEPTKDNRQRLVQLHNRGMISHTLFQAVKNDVMPLETLFIFGTNRSALNTVIQELDKEKQSAGQTTLTIERNEAVGSHQLLIPVYAKSTSTLISRKQQTRFVASRDELDLLARYLAYVSDDRVLLVRHNAQPKDLALLRKSVVEHPAYYRIEGSSSRRSADLLVRQVLDFFNVVPQEFDRLKELEDEIRHYRSIQVSFTDIAKLQAKIDRISQYRDPAQVKESLKLDLKADRIDIDEYTQQIETLQQQAVREETFQFGGQEISICNVANHYYVPLILSEDERISYIKHIIKTASEVRFIKALEGYVQTKENGLRQFDWWMFSKLDETLDEVYIPYYNPKMNGISRFMPDFVFWLQKGQQYLIVFVDPKGTKHADYQHKLDGYRQVFGEIAKPQGIARGKSTVKVLTYLYTSGDAGQVAEGYRDYWCDSIADLVKRIVSAVGMSA